MHRKTRGLWTAASALLFLFAVFSIIVSKVDVQAIGPLGSKVGLATINGAVHRALGEHFALYVAGDWLSIPAFLPVLCFGALGFLQLIFRKSIKRVDRDLVVLGGFYLAVLLFYILLEKVVVINYRPMLIDGVLEPSYPSSTTMLVLCVSVSAVFELQLRWKRRPFCKPLCVLLVLFALGMVVCRLVSGVHWLTDILGGILLSAALLLAYFAALGDFYTPQSGRHIGR